MESIYVSYRKGFYRKSAGLRVRAVPEMGFCLVFTPQDPNLYTLNPTSWLILEMCDGATPERLERVYWKEANVAYEEELKVCSMFVAPPRPVRSEVRGELREGLADLERRQVIEFIPAE